MAEDMFIAMGCSMDDDSRMDVGTLDMNTEGLSLSTAARMVVTEGPGSPDITFSTNELEYILTNLYSSANVYDLIIPTHYYYRNGTNVASSSDMTFTSTTGTYHGSLAGEKTGTVVRDTNLSVDQSAGSITVDLVSKNASTVHIDVGATSGPTSMTLRGLTPDHRYAIYVDSVYRQNKTADSLGDITFTDTYASDEIIVQDVGIVEEGEEPPVIPPTPPPPGPPPVPEPPPEVPSGDIIAQAGPFLGVFAFFIAILAVIAVMGQVSRF